MIVIQGIAFRVYDFIVGPFIPLLYFALQCLYLDFVTYIGNRRIVAKKITLSTVAQIEAVRRKYRWIGALTTSSYRPYLLCSILPSQGGFPSHPRKMMTHLLYCYVLLPHSAEYRRME